MIISRFVVSVAVACSLWACTASTSEPSEPLSAPELAVAGLSETSPDAVERFIAPTPAMLAAALSGNPQLMQDSVALTGCQAPSTCPAGFGACTAWSGPAACGFSCEPHRVCSCPIEPEHPDQPPNECPPESPDDPKLGKTTKNSFRVCFNSAQQSCTEWKQSFSYACGC